MRDQLLEAMVGQFQAASRSAREFWTVRDHDQCRSLASRQVEQEVGDAIGCIAIEIAGWFIGQEQLGLMQQRTRYGYALTFTTAESTGYVIDATAQAHFFDQLLGALDFRLLGLAIGQSR